MSYTEVAALVGRLELALREADVRTGDRVLMVADVTGASVTPPWHPTP